MGVDESQVGSGTQPRYDTLLSFGPVDTDVFFLGHLEHRVRGRLTDAKTEILIDVGIPNVVMTSINTKHKCRWERKTMRERVHVQVCLPLTCCPEMRSGSFTAGAQESQKSKVSSPTVEGLVKRAEVLEIHIASYHDPAALPPGQGLTKRGGGIGAIWQPGG